MSDMRSRLRCQMDSLAGWVGRKEDPELGELSQHPMGDRDSGNRTGKPRQAGGKDVRIEDGSDRRRRVRQADKTRRD